MVYWHGLSAHDDAPIWYVVIMRLAGMLIGYSLFGIFGALVGALLSIFVAVGLVVGLSNIAPHARRLYRSSFFASTRRAMS